MHVYVHFEVSGPTVKMNDRVVVMLVKYNSRLNLQ